MLHSLIICLRIKSLSFSTSICMWVHPTASLRTSFRTHVPWSSISQESLHFVSQESSLRSVSLFVSTILGCGDLFPSSSRMYDLLRTLFLAILFFIEWNMLIFLSIQLLNFLVRLIFSKIAKRFFFYIAWQFGWVIILWHELLPIFFFIEISWFHFLMIGTPSHSKHFIITHLLYLKFQAEKQHLLIKSFCDEFFQTLKCN